MVFKFSWDCVDFLRVKIPAAGMTVGKGWGEVRGSARERVPPGFRQVPRTGISMIWLIWPKGAFW